MNDMDGAVQSFSRAIHLKPDEASFHNNLAMTLVAMRKYDDALTSYERAVQLDPHCAAFFNNLAGLCHHLGHFDKAEEAIATSIRLDPKNALAHMNRGLTLLDREAFSESIDSDKKAIALNPTLAEARCNLGMLHLLLGDYPAGWEQYKFRLLPPLPVGRPLWRGEDLAGKCILLCAEQGLGDMIQFVRYVPILKQRGASVTVACQAELGPLLAQMAEVVTPGQMIPPHDFVCPILNLPMLLATTTANIPAEVPYVHVAPEAIRLWAGRVLPKSNRIRIGLAWAGSPRHRDDIRRSISFPQLAPLLNTAGCEFYSLQLGPAALQSAGTSLIDLTAHIHDFADTGALVHHLDLVISVDTAIVHLAAAMAKPTWILLAKLPDWRWMLNRMDSPWYPSVRLFRQRQRGNWEDVVQDIRAELVRLVGASPLTG
jgi:hypothetical protein